MHRSGLLATSGHWPDHPAAVEVLGKYCNPDATEAFRRLAHVPAGQKPAPPARNKQVQHRLRAAEVEELIEAYLAGATVYELGTRYRISRKTVSIILQREGVPTRYNLLTGPDLHRAVELYPRGDSLVTIGRVFDINASTVRKALIAAGVRMRDTHGRERSPLLGD